jgi:malonate transporter
MLLTSLSVLLPVLFVMGLGYWAGRTKRFDADQIRGLNELVMTYALPALMFVATVTTTRSEMFAEAPFLITLLISFLGLYVAVAVFSIFVLHHSLGEAGLQAFLITFPSVAFFGIPIFKGLFGEASLLSIASADVLASTTLAPLTIVLLEIGAQRSTSGEVQEVGALVWKGLVNSFAKPMVWAPLLGAVFVLLDVDFPKEIDNMLALIGSTTGGASLFLAGLIIASYSVKINTEILANVFGKMILQPALMVALVALFAIPNPLGREGILMCAIPASAVAPILAARYKVYETESASTVVLDSLLMLVTFTLAVVLIGG